MGRGGRGERAERSGRRRKMEYKKVGENRRRNKGRKP